MSFGRCVVVWAVLALGLSACDARVCGKATNDEGGFSKADTDGRDVQEAAEYAAVELTGDPRPAYEVVCAQTQVVAGTNYRMGLELEDDAETWLVEVYEDLDGGMALKGSERR